MRIVGNFLLVLLPLVLSGCKGGACTRCLTDTSSKYREPQPNYETACLRKKVLEVEVRTITQRRKILSDHSTSRWVIEAVQALALDPSDPLSLKWIGATDSADEGVLEVWAVIPSGINEYDGEFEIRVRAVDGGGGLVTMVRRDADGKISWEPQRSSSWGFVTSR